MQPVTNPFHPSVVCRLAAAQEAAQRDPGYASHYYARRRPRLAGLKSGLGDWTSFGGEVKNLSLLSLSFPISKSAGQQFVNLIYLPFISTVEFSQ